MGRMGVLFAALLLASSSVGALAFQPVGKKPTAAQLAAVQQQVAAHKISIGQVAANQTQPPPTVCIEGPDCVSSNTTANQASSAGNVETNAITNSDGNTVSNVANTVTSDTKPGNTAVSVNTSGASTTDDGNNAIVLPPTNGNNLPIIVGALVVLVVLVILGGAASFALYRHNLLVKTRGLLSLRTKLVQASAPSNHPDMKFEWPPLSIRTRLDEGVTSHG